MSYNVIPLPQFLFAIAIVALPEFMLAQGGEEKYARAYAFLILLSYAIYNYRGLQQFGAFVRKEIGQ